MLGAYIGCIIVLLLSAGTLKADEWKVRFADSTKLHTPPWHGSLSSFSLTEEGLTLQIAHPKRSYNRAFLSTILKETPNCSWGGSISFDFLPSVQNRIVLLLYPYRAIRNSAGNEEKDWVALEVGANNPPLLVTLTAEEMPEGYYRIGTTKSLLGDGLSYPYTSNMNRIDWRINKDATGHWQLYLNTYNDLKNEFRLIGEASLPQSAYSSKRKAFTTALAFVCSKTNAADRLSIHELSFADEPLTPSISSTQESIIADMKLSEHAISLLCRETPDISKASFEITPPKEVLPGTVQKKSIELVLKAPLGKGIYTLSITGVRYPDGALSPDEEIIFQVEDNGSSHTTERASTSLCLSEVMPRPIPSSAEYIELYNSGTERVDLNEYGFALRSEGRLGKIVPIKTSHRLLEANAYRAVTPWAEALILTHHITAEEIAESRTFPSLPNTNGQIALVRLSDTLIIEEMTYTASQITIEDRKEGIALERSCFDCESLLPANWHAAAASVGYATPGKANSNGNPPGMANDEEQNLLSPLYIALQMLNSLKEEHCKLQMTFYSLRGQRIGIWTHEQCSAWAEATARGESTAVPIPTIFNCSVVVAEIQKGDSNKPEHFNFVYLH